MSPLLSRIENVENINPMLASRLTPAMKCKEMQRTFSAFNGVQQATRRRTRVIEANLLPAVLSSDDSTTRAGD